jgi:hypothetical protein
VKEKSMHPRRRQKDLRSIGDVLQKTLKKMNISINSTNRNDWNVWYKVTGPQIAAQTQPQKLRGDTLFVKVSTSVWMHQLQFMKQEIIDKINESLGRETIKNIYFSIGAISPAIPKNKEKFPFPRQYILNERDTRMIKESAGSIADKELSDILKRVMTKEIIRRRMREGSRAP